MNGNLEHIFASKDNALWIMERGNMFGQYEIVYKRQIVQHVDAETVFAVSTKL